MRRPPGCRDANAQVGETDDAAATQRVVHNQIETVGVVDVVEVSLSEDGLVELWERHRDEDRVSVHLEAVRAEYTIDCPDAEEAFSLIIAIDRGHLPADDFTVEVIVDGMRQAETTSSA